jgi:cytochrome P450
VIATTLGDLEMPAGTQLVVLTRPPAVTARSFHDPDSFRPERWLGDAGASGVHDPAAHLPFGSGPRICPGRGLALLEMKVVLALIYKSFKVTREGPADRVREALAFTMSPSGLAVRLARRATSA